MVLQRMQAPGTQSNLAQAMGVSESTISRTKDDIEPVMKVLAHLGLKVVPVEMKCYPEKEIDAIFALAKAHLAQAQSADDMLRWDD